MKGLLKNNFYSMSASLKDTFYTAFIGIFIPILTGEEKMITFMIVLQIVSFIEIWGICLNSNKASKWAYFEATLPVVKVIL